MKVSAEQMARDEAEVASAKMRAEYDANKEEKKAKARANPQVGAHSELRRKILSLSLFPNIVRVSALKD